MSSVMQAITSGDIAELQRLIDANRVTFRGKNASKQPLLHSAILAQRPRVVEVLIRAGIDVNEVSPNTPMTPLQRAMISVANAEIVEILLSHNAEIPVKTHYLAWKGDADSLKQLKETAEPIYTRDSFQNSVMHYAVAGKAYSVVAWLLSLSHQFLEMRDNHGRTPFLRAAIDGSLEMLRELKRQGADVRAVDKQGANALHLAALAGNAEVVEWLLDLEGAPFSLEDKTNFSRTPFSVAAETGQLEVLKRLKERGADVRVVDNQGYNPFHLAALFSGDTEVVEWFLDLDDPFFSIEERDQTSSRTPFLLAATKGQLETLKVLKDRGANIRATDISGHNALHLAAIFGHAEVVEWLLDLEGAPFPLENGDNLSRTPFLLATAKSHLEALRVLKNRGANIWAVDRHGNNALHLAAAFGNSEIIEWLLPSSLIKRLLHVIKGTLFSLEDTSNASRRTPFLLAAEQGNLEALKTLKERGANMRAVDCDDRNALHLAAMSSRNTKAIEWLLGLEAAPFLLEGKDRLSRTPFLVAAIEGQLEALRVLKSRGANTRAIDRYSMNAVHLARRNREVMAWLLFGLTTPPSLKHKG